MKWNKNAAFLILNSLNFFHLGLKIKTFCLFEIKKKFFRKSSSFSLTKSKGLNIQSFFYCFYSTKTDNKIVEILIINIAIFLILFCFNCVCYLRISGIKIKVKFYVKMMNPGF